MWLFSSLSFWGLAWESSFHLIRLLWRFMALGGTVCLRGQHHPHPVRLQPPPGESMHRQPRQDTAQEVAGACQ